ncbi:MAG: carboxypeptidase-like regulatory domain-containing protein [Bacteroidota bacterium]|nr:MAG: carboxypeptidase-like regulatory domain-containing protein [Bacteroidota bacterium]
MKIVFGILFFCFLSSRLTANDPIKGIVLDAKTKEPLAFANIVVSGQQKGTVSNSEGNYVLAMDGISPSDTVMFYYMGYETLKIRASKLQQLTQVEMKPSSIKLREVHVSSKQLEVREILSLVRKNFAANYPDKPQKRSIFFHTYEKTPFPETNKITLKKSDFVGLDRKTFDELLDLMPREFIEYQDAVIDLFNLKENYKLLPVQAISLEEGSYQAITKEIESKLSVLFEDIEKTKAEPDVYYKIRSGLLSQKLDKNGTNDSIWKEYKNDPTNYTVETKFVQAEIVSLLSDYSTIDSKNWEFITDPAKYRYKKEGFSMYNDEQVYKISFTPQSRGKFQGTMYISMLTYAVLQLDFEFAEGVQTEQFDVLGFEHSMNMKKGRVLFEKGKNGYFIRYISANQNESARVERELSIIKKQKRFLTDKELNEIKMELEIFFDINSSWELLVLNTEEIEPEKFEEVKQPLLMKFKIEYAYTPEMWNNRTVLVPTAELKKVKRKE